MWQWAPHVCVRFMARHPQLFVFVSLTLVTFITRYGNSSFSSKPIILPPMPPRKFFPFNSPVLEFPFGRVTPLLELTVQDEITFVMYYAPWCTKSMTIRWEFHKAAKFMINGVKFVAINCWWNEGECRRKYKFMSYPVLYVYHTILDGYQYSGVHTAEHFVKFLEDILYPISYLHDETEMQKFVTLNDNAVIGYFDFNSAPQPPGYMQFYYASMRAIEKDPLQVLKFGVVTSPFLAKELTIGPNPGAIVMVKHRTILKNPIEGNFTSSQIVKWAFEVRQQPLVKILSPSGMKSLHLSTEIAKGATVIMFYIHNPLFDANQHYHMLREVALDYIKCSVEKDESLDELSFASFNHRLSSMKKMQEAVEICGKSYPQNQQQQQAGNIYLKPSLSPNPFDRLGMNDMSPPSPMCRCCVSVLHKQLLQGHVYHNVCEVCYSHNLTDGACHTLQSCPAPLAPELRDHMYSTLSNKCLEFSPNYLPDQHKSVCCHQVLNAFPPPLSSSSLPLSSYSYSETTLNSDPFGSSEHKRSPPPKHSGNKRSIRDPFIEEVLMGSTERLCRRLNFQLAQGVPLDIDLNLETLEPIKSDNFTGLSCRTNRTVLFYAMDIINHSIFAERLGINTTELVRTKKPTVIIIDEQDEKSYFLKKSFTKSFVAEFILNYTNGDIEREILSAHSTSSGSVALNQPSSNSDNHNKSEANSDWRTNLTPNTDFVSPSTSSNIIRVTEVTSHTFQQLVINTSNDVLLLYYTPWCGFCASFAHIYLALAKYFQQATNLLFARINGESEDLPWEYTADTYPTLLFFPSGRKQDSVVFSEDLPKSLPNLIRFVLHHTTHSVRLQANAARHCTKQCIHTNLHNALNRISILDKQLKRLHHRLARLEGSFFRSNFLNTSHKADPSMSPVQATSLFALRMHWNQQIDKKQRQKQICLKLVQLLQRTSRSLDKNDLVMFMKNNDILLESALNR